MKRIDAIALAKREFLTANTEITVPSVSLWIGKRF